MPIGVTSSLREFGAAFGALAWSAAVLVIGTGAGALASLDLAHRVAQREGRHVDARRSLHA